ncbi:MAG: ribonuclease III [Lachnospiraceae bacterium]|nr:ribonuclease III [Lachnospiraceae bacterium]
MSFERFQEMAGYTFRDAGLLTEALSHSSYTNEMKINRCKNNERLEFLGDAVLELISSEFLFFEHRDKAEGDLSKVRASLVCEKALAYCARKLELGDNISLGKGERLTGGSDRDSILSDALEAVIGAIYLDGGYESAKAFVLRHVLEDMEEKRIFVDSKSVLQEMVHDLYHGARDVSYEVTRTEGPEHSKVFYVDAFIGDEKIASGQGKNKKAAEQAAAYETIRKLRQDK